MIVVDLPPSKLKPYHNNPRHNDAAVPAVAKSIQEFGFRQAIVVDKDHVIVVGHTRWRAAMQLGLKTVPVHVAKDMTPEQCAAYRLADNRTAELADWDEDALLREIASLSGAGFDLKGMGFTDEELGEFDAPPKNDVRYLEDFEVMPKPKPHWILISAQEDECAGILSAIRSMPLNTARVEYSGDPSPSSKYVPPSAKK